MAKNDTAEKKSTQASKPAKASSKSAKKNTGKNEKPSLWARLVGYLKGVKTELFRVVWPSRDEVINSSIVVVVTLIFFIIFCLIVDQISSAAIVGFKGLAG